MKGSPGCYGISMPMYAKIGPMFNARIKDWNHHLKIIASFWETLIGGPSTYAGPMPMKHLPLGLRKEDFERWLFLWQANCRAQLPSDVAKEMIDLADHIAHRLRMIPGISTFQPTIFKGGLGGLRSRSRRGPKNINE
jgi:truncated hemoglobin YjbI